MNRLDREDLQVRGVSAAGRALLSALLATCHIRRSGTEHIEPYREGVPVVFTLWHGRLLPCTHAHRGEGIAALISQHRDGEYIARVVERWGFETVRGSSRRGGTSALRELVRRVRRGTSLAITPDGPTGPRERMKIGALHVARATGAPLIPVGGGADRGWLISSWDRFLVPKPFSRIHIVYGEPLFVPRDADERALTELAGEMERRLGTVTRKADA